MSDSATSLPAYQKCTLPAYKDLYPSTHPNGLVTPRNSSLLKPQGAPQQTVLAVYNSCSYEKQTSYSVLNYNTGRLVYQIEAGSTHAETSANYRTLQIVDVRQANRPLVHLVDLSQPCARPETVFLEDAKWTPTNDARAWTFRTEHDSTWAVYQRQMSRGLPRLLKDCLGISDRCLSICRLGATGQPSPPVGQYIAYAPRSPGSMNGRMVLDAREVETEAERARVLASVVAVLESIKSAPQR